MANPPSGHDPSMEDILASIRRIIVDDDDKATEASDTAPSDDEDEDEDEDVLELTDLAEEDLTSSGRDSVNRPSILDITASPGEQNHNKSKFAKPSHPDNGGSEETMANTPNKDDDRLMSRDTATSAASSLSSLARASEPDPLHGIPKGRPIEELVMEALKPMLSEWLNEHLPAIVERIVEREVRYLSRRPQDD